MIKYICDECGCEIKEKVFLENATVTTSLGKNEMRKQVFSKYISGNFHMLITTKGVESMCSNCINKNVKAVCERLILDINEGSLK